MDHAIKARMLFIQLGFHPDYRDAGALASTYNDGIYYVASFLKRQFPDITTDVCQMFWAEEPRDFAIESYDYILISSLATTFYANKPALDEIARRRKKSAKVIFGGAHATFAPHEVLDYADYAILGEGEIAVAKLIHCLETGGEVTELENICYVGDDGLMVINRNKHYQVPDNPLMPELLRSSRRGRIQWAAVSFSRGCPYSCSFCYSIRILGREFRPKDAQSIPLELQAIHREIDARRFYVSDINFGTNKRFCHEVAEAVRPLDYRFIAMTRIEIADDVELLRELKSAGFEEYYIGVESESADVLKLYNKRCDASQQTQRLLRLADEDIYVQSGIMFGLDSQGPDDIQASARWCAEARITHPIFMCRAEYPFQKILFNSHQDVEDHRIIIGGPTYQHYSYVGIFPRNMPPSVLQRRILDCYGTFFERAHEIETRPQRRMRLKNHARCVAPGNNGMLKHIQFLEEIEKPYYNAAGELREGLLESDFESRYGALRERLRLTVRQGNPEKVYAT